MVTWIFCTHVGYPSQIRMQNTKLQHFEANLYAGAYGNFVLLSVKCCLYQWLQGPRVISCRAMKTTWG